MTLLRTALVYDFDGTLAPGNIQEHSLIPRHLKTTIKAFWDLVREEEQAPDADEIVVLERARGRRRMLRYARQVRRWLLDRAMPGKPRFPNASFRAEGEG